LAAEAGQSIVVPAHKGRRGHPVLFSKDVLEEVLALAPSMGANTIVRSVPDRVIEVEVEDPGILIDIDTPAQFEQWIGSESE
jgi:molybdenum cofactor cytidylyltransferase